MSAFDCLTGGRTAHGSAAPLLDTPQCSPRHGAVALCDSDSHEVEDQHFRVLLGLQYITWLMSLDV